ncbi:3D domain-containing protein [Paenibacillus aurantius]|uniref:3D domain-containing protein n=1 Tax=Paenibacillus aurantius TaxID=2918900 RepID=A0AA96RC64_9BACL|nr:3D domain-containing protein [Paenibacillus aurantius]WJH34953.1 3D domain-containing protein [Paenibacillus sp. CC-CFT747]WNQ10195.1 3D domain-containing protein [Paenibacillus aurantius]
MKKATRPSRPGRHLLLAAAIGAAVLAGWYGKDSQDRPVWAVPQDRPPAGEGQLDPDIYALLDLKQLDSVEVVATGYYAGKESTGKSPGHPEYGITFSGVKVRKDLFSTIAADPRVFPLGTVLYIPGYGYGVVADTGNLIKGYKIDLYFDTKQQVYDLWGKKKVKVSVLKRGDGKVTEAMMDRLNAVKKVVKPEGKASPL